MHDHGKIQLNLALLLPRALDVVEKFKLSTFRMDGVVAPDSTPVAHLSGRGVLLDVEPPSRLGVF